jgi:hypothetical protein
MDTNLEGAGCTPAWSYGAGESTADPRAIGHKPGARRILERRNRR